MTNAELYVVATPLGNIRDITLRAIDCLKGVSHLFAEDTRESMKLLELCGISLEGKKFHSYASHNLKKATQTATRILIEGQSIALLSDRGTPGVSDPGALLVASAREAGVKVVPLPGPSAVTTLFSVSGITQQDFVFLGFLPKETKYREALFGSLAKEGRPACFYESPRRIRETYLDLQRAFPQGTLFIGREMTKVYEEFRWLKLNVDTAEALPEQGEYVVILQPGETQSAAAWADEVALRASSDREWSKQIAARHDLAASEVYNALLRARESRKA
jgi:16S rRNA (cytidine1402-2'-O)-methyltransferase